MPDLSAAMFSVPSAERSVFAKPAPLTYDQLRDKFREHFLAGLDKFAGEVLGYGQPSSSVFHKNGVNGEGAEDIDLPELFRVVEPHFNTLLERALGAGRCYNPNSEFKIVEA